MKIRQKRNTKQGKDDKETEGGKRTQNKVKVRVNRNRTDPVSSACCSRISLRTVLLDT